MRLRKSSLFFNWVFMQKESEGYLFDSWVITFSPQSLTIHFFDQYWSEFVFENHLVYDKKPVTEGMAIFAIYMQIWSSFFPANEGSLSLFLDWVFIDFWNKIITIRFN